MIIKSITEQIGQTPLLEIPATVHGLHNIALYAKLEFLNPWGSVKDRTALGLLQPQLSELPHKRVIENSSGNTAKALQLLAGMHGSQLKVMTNLIKDTSVKDILTLIGADITELPGTSDCFDPTDPNDPSFYIAQEIKNKPEHYIYTDQFVNTLNRDMHYRTTGQEIVDDLGIVHYFIAGVGTAGSSLGISEKLREQNQDIDIVGVVAEKDDYLPGIRTYDELLQVGLFDPIQYTDIMSVSSSDAIDAMLQLIRRVGLAAGPTTGASYLAALRHLRAIDHSLTAPQTAVFIACDRLEWYMSYIRERKPELFSHSATPSWKEGVRSSPEYSMSVSETTALIAHDNPMIVDLRQAISFKISHIPNSINLPMEYLDKILNVTNPFCTKKPIVLVCPIGEKSELVAAYLQTLGVRAMSLSGGITAWRDAGEALERDTM